MRAQRRCCRREQFGGSLFGSSATPATEGIQISRHYEGAKLTHASRASERGLPEVQTRQRLSRLLLKPSLRPIMRILRHRQPRRNRLSTSVLVILRRSRQLLLRNSLWASYPGIEEPACCGCYPCQEG
ncbi:hypothetical protein FIBSPDRAFT_875281 [Athelia psychrophila]|uniref:Uncharacterized protein n=1 Tax=Athelia psychrophila TaxID=1759441 RepID=A0A165WJL4_9AGAM|nr:hypothetical protein FIBSPDRAFT_875281 [Fibularhizoctonia sp. CBS 109695]